MTRIKSKLAWYTLQDFGITTRLKQTGYKGGRIPQYMLKQNAYKGKKLWYNRKLYICIESTTNTATIKVNGKLIKLHRRDTIAPKGTIPIYKTKTSEELIQEIRVRYPDAKLKFGRGCSLHGDVDGYLTIKGEEYRIPWNY